jgi:transcriptional regulator with XRE-family HTH domain
VTDQIQNIDLSTRLRELMLSHKMSVSELATIAGVSKSAMEKYLAGPSSPRAVALVNISNALKISLDWLIAGQTTHDVQVEYVALTSTARHVILDYTKHLISQPELLLEAQQFESGQRQGNLVLLTAAQNAAQEVWFGFKAARESAFIAEPIELKTDAAK